MEDQYLADHFVHTFFYLVSQLNRLALWQARFVYQTQRIQRRIGYFLKVFQIQKMTCFSLTTRRTLERFDLDTFDFPVEHAGLRWSRQHLYCTVNRDMIVYYQH